MNAKCGKPSGKYPLLAATRHKQKSQLNIRILAVFFHPSTSVTAMGGAEKRLAENLKILCSQDNVEITVLESTPSLLLGSEVTCKKHLLSSSFHGKGWLGTYLEWAFWLLKAVLQSPAIISREKPNVIYIPNNTLPNLTLGYSISLIFSRPRCLVVHHIDIPLSRAGSKTNSFYASYRSMNYSRTVSLAKTLAFYFTLPILRKMKTIIAVSNFTAEALRAYGITKSRILVSGNAISFDSINSIEPYTDGKTFDGVFVGRIAKEKGIFDLLDLWRDVVKNRKDARLLVIGDGLELAVLREKTSIYGLGKNIVFQGRCSEKELYGLLKSCRVFIFPSLLEGWGIAVAEALACGLPVVAYDIPALREIFGECKSVFLIPTGNISKMTQVVLAVMDSQKGKLAEISRTYAKNFRWYNVAMADLAAVTDAATGDT